MGIGKLGVGNVLVFKLNLHDGAIGNKLKTNEKLKTLVNKPEQ